MAGGDVTVVLTVWKRNNLAEQLDALLNQTQRPGHIWVCQDERHINIDRIKKRFPYVEFINSTVNFKYFGRFALAQFAQTDYVWILDDDVIPSTTWLARARTRCASANAIISSAGRIIPAGDYWPEKMANVQNYFFGDVPDSYISHNVCAEETVVDFGCNGWLLKTDWLKTFWQTPPCTLDIAEDIHLSAACMTAQSIPTLVLSQTDEQDTGNLKVAYGRDAFASWTKPGFLDSRANVIRYWVEEQSWRPMQWSQQAIQT